MEDLQSSRLEATTTDVDSDDDFETWVLKSFRAASERRLPQAPTLATAAAAPTLAAAVATTSSSRLEATTTDVDSGDDFETWMLNSFREANAAKPVAAPPTSRFEAAPYARSLVTNPQTFPDVMAVAKVGLLADVVADDVALSSVDVPVADVGLLAASVRPPALPEPAATPTPAAAAAAPTLAAAAAAPTPAAARRWTGVATEMSAASLTWKTSNPERVRAFEDAATQRSLPISFALKNTAHDCKEALLAILRGHPSKQVYVGTTIDPIRRWLGDTREEFLGHRAEHPQKRLRPLQTGHGQPRNRNRPPPYSEMHILAYAPHKKALLLEPYLIYLARDHSDGWCVNKAIDARGMTAEPNFLYVVIDDLVGPVSLAPPVVHPTNPLRFTS
jgi:hypothetical protein